MTEDNQKKIKKDKISSGLVIAGTVFVFLLALLAIIAILLPGYLAARELNAFNSCQWNLKNIDSACDMYALDNKEYYPETLTRIVPDYIPRIPACPVAKTDTYSESYSVNNKIYKLKFTLDGKTYYNYNVNNGDYTYYCKGKNHIKMDIAPPDYPKFSQRDEFIPK